MKKLCINNINWHTHTGPKPSPSQHDRKYLQYRFIRGKVIYFQYHSRNLSVQIIRIHKKDAIFSLKTLPATLSQLPMRYLLIQTTTQQPHVSNSGLNRPYLTPLRVRYFSACDATWGFWQIKLHQSDKPKTAFCTPSGLYQWRVLPVGLSNSPAIFQRTMSSFFLTSS